MQKFFMKEGKESEIIKLAEGFEKYKNPLLHEAGFDSYITIWVFLHLKNCLPSI